MNHTVLVVDDDPSIRAIVVDLLVGEGYQAEAAADGREALDVLSRLRPCLILLDMRMPVLDGWGFAQAARERGLNDIPVVVMTAAADARAWADEVGANDFVAKPFDVEQLLDRVARFCPAA